MTGVGLDEIVLMLPYAPWLAFILAILGLLLRFLTRGDRLQERNISELHRLIKSWRERAEKAEKENRRLRERARRLEERLLDAGSRVTGEIPIQKPPEE